MTQTADKLSPFLATSAVLHGSLFALVVFGPALFPKHTEAPWGTSTVKGITVGVTESLPGIPLPSPPVVRETAKPNDSKTLHPADVVPKAQPKAPSKPAQVKIPQRGATKVTKAEPATSRVAKADIPPAPSPATNAIPGGGGQISLPYGQAAGTEQATFGGDGTFGTRFPQYVTAMTRAIESKWRDTIPITSRGSSQRVYVTFTIDRNGRASNLDIEKKSDSIQLDNSAKRAVNTATLPPLPAEYRGTSVDVRFYFDVDYTR
jgi:TonB family protein